MEEKVLTKGDLWDMFIENKYAMDRIVYDEMFSNNLILQTLQSAALDSKRDNFLMEYPHGNIIQQGTKDAYYRGENKIYDKVTTSLQRKLYKYNEDDKKVYNIISDMKIYEFKRLIDKFYIVQRESKVKTILYECLAQHYGLETSWLDITSDFKTALFFATCYFDKTENQYKPLTEDMIKEYKYGVIYKKICHDIDMRNNNEILKYDPIRGGNAILPIGYQPFMRCESQNAYGIKNINEINLSEIGFIKCKFEHSVELSKWVYYISNYGKNIFPNEGILKIENQINEIKNLKTFSRESLKYAISKSEDFDNEDICMKEIKRLDKEIEIIDEVEPIKIDKSKIDEIDIDYEMNIFAKMYRENKKYEILNNKKSS